MAVKTGKKQGRKEKQPHELTIIDSRVLIAEDGDKISTTGVNKQIDRGAHVINFREDSYIMLFSGRRGGGKSTSMVFYALKSMVLYPGMRLMSNFPIECLLRFFRPDGKSYLRHIKSEPLDFNKLILQDSSFENSLILIDESPDIISHLASQSWKNRLVAAFTRQLRKAHNTLLLGAQDESLIDKSMRWQVDVRIDCLDLSRKLGYGSDVERGECVILTFYDDSGIWTGTSTEERSRSFDNNRWTHWNNEDGHLWVQKLHLFPRILWGNPGKTKPVFDSWLMLDVLDNLRGIDMRLSKTVIGDDGVRAAGSPAVRSPAMFDAVGIIECLRNNESKAVKQTEFWASFGSLSRTDKDGLSKLLNQFGVNRTGSGNSRMYDFTNFDLESLRGRASKTNPS